MKMFIVWLKVTGFMVLETLFAGLMTAMPLFFICYTCDVWWGEHMTVRTADLCYRICLCIGLAAGLTASCMSTRKLYKDYRSFLGNRTVK